MRKFIVSLIFCLVVVMACSTSKPKEEEPSPDEITFSGNSNGNKRLPESPYGYEIWAAGGSDHKITWYGPDARGGAAFRAEWNYPNDFLGRVGYFWNQGKPYTNYGDLSCKFDYTRSANGTGGSYSYIGIYGWSKNPLIEYYIVEDCFNSSVITTGTTGGSVQGSYTLDDSVYQVIKNTRVGKPSIEGTATFDQFFSIRQSRRQSGTISITEHFKKWEEMGLQLGSNMYEAKFLVEAGGGKGWFEASYLSFE